MVRDIVEAYTNEEVVLHNLSNGSKNYSYPRRYTKKSFRSDSVPTTPWPDGGYHATTGYSAFFGTSLTSSGSVRWTWVPSGPEYLLSWTGGECPLTLLRHGCTSQYVPDVPAWLISQCRAEMHRQVLEDLDVSQFAGEARETARLIGNILYQLLRFIKSVKGGNYKGYKNMAIYELRKRANSDGVARLYLSIMYGIRPLVQEVVKIARHWDNRCEAPISKDLFVDLVDPTFSVPQGTPTWAYTGIVGRGIKSGATAMVLNPQLLRASQYGLTSPLSLAWELTTLSFVVDWFTGIGSWIRGLEHPLGVAIIDHYETRWVRNRIVSKEDRYGGLYENPYTKLIGPRTTRDTIVLSKAMLRLGAPYLLPPPPYIRLGVNASQVVSLLALIRVHMK